MRARTPPIRLADLNPSFWDAGDRVGCGVMFDCPCRSAECPRGGREQITFANPLDGGPRINGWERTGDTFDTLVLRPSISTPIMVDGKREEHWHGFIGGIDGKHPGLVESL